MNGYNTKELKFNNGVSAGPSNEETLQKIASTLDNMQATIEHHKEKKSGESLTVEQLKEINRILKQ